MMPGDKRTWILLVVHALCSSLCTALVAFPQARGPSVSVQSCIMLFQAILYCQANLLAIWAAYGEEAWGIRLIGLMAGGGCLDGLFWAAGLGFIGLPCLTIMALAVAILLHVSRPTGVRLRLLRPPPIPPGDGKFRFSIRGLMAAILFVAVLIVATEGLKESIAAVLVADGSCFAVAGLVSPWAALGLARPTARCLVAFSIPAALRALFIARIYMAKIEIFLFYYIFFTTILEAALLIGSLLLLRSSGFRLVGRSGSGAGVRDFSSTDENPYDGTSNIDIDKILSGLCD